jgi:ABC-2 type transport system permease protein
MRNVLLIARREYLEQIRGRGFRLSTVGLPMLFAVIVGIGYAASLGLGSHKHLVVASSNGALANDVREKLVRQKNSSAAVDVVSPLTPEKRMALTGMIQTGMVDGVLWIEGADSGLPSATYTSKSTGDFMTATRLREALNGSIEEEHLAGSGMTIAQADAVTRGIKIETFQIKSDGSVMQSNAEASFWKGYVMAFLLSLTTMIYGMNVARSIIQEKTSRIFEVMLATVKPGDLLAGKLVGVGAVGLTQIAIWLVAGLAILATPFAAAVLSGDFSIHFSWYEAILFPMYFVLGYLLYSSLFAGLAATCETEQELQMYMPLAAAPTWLSFALIVLVMNDSNSVWSIAASLFPPTAPVIMFLRMASEIPPVWQFVASIGLLVASILGTLWFASRLYRIGILMYGKRATIPEIVRWLRYS